MMDMCVTRKSLVSLAVGALCVMLACSDYRPVEIRYEAEKRLHAAEKAFSTAQVKGELTKPEVVAAVQNSFADVVSYCFDALGKVDRNSQEWGELSALAFRSSTRLSQFMFIDKKYDSCAAILTNLASHASLPVLESAALRVNLGQALQACGRWDSAIASYNSAIAMLNPPLDQDKRVVYSVFNLPTHIFRVYSKIGDQASAELEFRRAVDYYRRFISSFPNAELGTASRANLAGLFADKGDWRGAVSELRQLTDSSGKIVLDAEVRIADIYAGELALYDSAFSMYERIDAHLVAADTAVRPVLIFKRSLVYLAQKQYAKSRQLLTNLDHDYKGYFMVSPAAQFTKAKTFELEGNWDRAEPEYRYLIENYSGSEEAMSAYLYLGDELAKRGRKNEADRWMDKAEAFYQQVADRNPNSSIEARAMTYKSELSRRKSDWAGSAKTLTSIYTKYPESEVGQKALLLASDLYRQKIGDVKTADSLVDLLKRTMINFEAPSPETSR